MSLLPPSSTHLPPPPSHFPPHSSSLLPSSLLSSLLSLLPSSSSSSPSSLIDQLINHLPSVEPTNFEESLQTMRNVCLNQEVDIQTKMKSYLKYDIYAEFEKINGELKGLRFLKGEELYHKYLESLEIARNSTSNELLDKEMDKLSSAGKESEIGYDLSEDCFDEQLEGEGRTVFNKMDEEFMEEGFKSGGVGVGELSGFSQKTRKMAVDSKVLHDLLAESENLPYSYNNNCGVHGGREENILQAIDMNNFYSNNRCFFD